jgi:phosphatidylcholine synthase
MFNRRLWVPAVAGTTVEIALPAGPLQIRAFAVHLFTASGAAFGLLAMIAAAHGAWVWMFLWLGIAAIVDGIDGALARHAKVAEVLPRWSGDVLDLVIDFTTYAFIPAFAIAVSGLLPPVVDKAVAVAIVVSAALYFADREMKLPGNYFRGFPTLWNIAAFYLFVLKPEPSIGALALGALVVLTFVPFRFIHPVRVRRWRNLNLTLLVVWSLLALLALARGLDPGPWIALGLGLIGLYFFAFGLFPCGDNEQE